LVQAGCAIAVNCGDLSAADRYVKLVEDVAVKHGLAAWRMWGQSFAGVLLIQRGDPATGSQQLGAALKGLPEGSLYLNRNLFAVLAEGLAAAGRTGEGLALIEEALARVGRTNERWCHGELLRAKGELLLLHCGPSAIGDAHACFQETLDMARRQGALSLELRAAMSLARLWSGQQQGREACQALAAVYRRFTEGLGTADLLAAGQLLAAVQTDGLASLSDDEKPS
jgi:predicted ATPase